MLSIDTGRPSTMSYPLQHPQRASGVLANGFATSRINKADGSKTPSIPSLPTISTSLYEDPNAFSAAAATRASSRAQLLAGLRTAPKTPTAIDYSNIPTAFESDTHADSSTSTGLLMNKPERSFVHESTRGFPAPAFPGLPPSATRAMPQEHHGIPFANFGGLPTPPTSSQYAYPGDPDYDSKVYADLLSRSFSFAQQQHQQLAQQMRINQQLQQLPQTHAHMQPIQIQSPALQSVGTPPISPAVYSPATSNHQAIHPLYSVYNQTNNQYNYFSHQNRNNHALFQTAIPSDPISVATLTTQLSLSSPSTIDSATRTSSSRSSPSPTKEFTTSNNSTAKKTPTPPPTSGPAFRRGHKKCISLSGCTHTNPALADSGPKTSIPRFSNVPSTPVNSTFGGRGDHPIRQPRGPPALEEIVAKPNAKLEGSKNFSSRQRRRALTKLVNAGIERRGTKTPASSAIGMMSVSEHDVVNFVESDGHSIISHKEDNEDAPPYKTDGRHTPKRAGLAAPQLAIYSAEKRRSAIF